MLIRQNPMSVNIFLALHFIQLFTKIPTTGFIFFALSRSQQNRRNRNNHRNLTLGQVPMKTPRSPIFESLRLQWRNSPRLSWCQSGENGNEILHTLLVGVKQNITLIDRRSASALRRFLRFSLYRVIMNIYVYIKKIFFCRTE